MAHKVVMPQMGESIAEGTIVKWHKQVGDKVQRDETLFEISTDKVDAEIPSPASGVLAEIQVAEGQTVAVQTVVALIAQEGEKLERAAAPAPEPTGQAAKAEPQQEPAQQAESAQRRPERAQAQPAQETEQPSGVLSLEAARRQRSSPLVRRMAKEHGVDISGLQGSGIDGRVTKQDLLDYLERGPAPAAVPSAPQVARAGLEAKTEPMSVMRKKIAEHMVAARRTAAHVHSVFEVDFTAVAELRQRIKQEFEQRTGAKLTYLPFVIRAMCEALRELPVVGAHLDGDNVVYPGEVNVGMAVALDWGLIVPVIRQAERKSLAQIAATAKDLADRARAKKLKPEEVQGANISITNPGGYGDLFGLPIIPLGTSAILGMGSIQPRPAVVDGALAVRTRGHLALSYDHRLIDGAVAHAFMARIKTILENFEAHLVLSA
ncbi:MAG TPA: dihydrolipoamide acetyltransferase family protein [Acidobacteriota bacterium]